MNKGITKKVVEGNFKGTVYIPESKPTFNKWIDKIFAHVESKMDEKYGFNKPSTGET